MNEKKQNSEAKEPQKEQSPPDPPDFLFHIKADGSWEMPSNVNPYMLPTLLRRAANQLEKRLTEVP